MPLQDGRKLRGDGYFRGFSGPGRGRVDAVASVDNMLGIQREIVAAGCHQLSGQIILFPNKRAAEGTRTPNDLPATSLAQRRPRVSREPTNGVDGERADLRECQWRKAPKFRVRLIFWVPQFRPDVAEFSRDTFFR